MKNKLCILVMPRGDKMKNRDMIFINQDINTKDNLFSFIADKLVSNNYATDKEEVKAKFYERETVSPTGMENGIAIPHFMSETISEPIMIIVRVNDYIKDYESLMPENKVKLIFAIAIPAGEGGEHLKILSELAKKLGDKGNILDMLLGDENTIFEVMNKEIKVVESKKESKKKILALTACATGIAHTYMAADYLEKKCAELGFDIKVEKQGANGLEDEITEQDIKEADVVIFAHDVELMNLSRFDGMKYIDCRVQRPIKDVEGCIQDALNSTDMFNSGEKPKKQKKEKGQNEVMQAMMTGISHMIPVIVAGGVLMGIAKLIALMVGGDALVNDLSSYLTVSEDQLVYGANMFYTFLAYLDKFGWLVLQMMYPMFAAYTAYSIGGKNALIAGFMGGIFAAGIANNMFNFPEIYSGIMTPVVGDTTMQAVSSGFMGALILALVAGYSVKFMNGWKFPQIILPLKTMLIIPTVSVLLVVLLNLFIVEPVFSYINLAIQNFILAHANSVYVYGVIIACATAFDLGGPVNKAAGTVAMALAADGIIALTARELAIVIPAFGAGCATFIDKLVFRKSIYSPEEKVLGQTSFILGFLGISEGAIPFMLRHPLITIPINMAGASIGVLIALYLGAEQWLPLPAIWGWPLVENLWAYLIGLLVGTLFIAISINIARIKKGDIQ